MDLFLFFQGQNLFNCQNFKNKKTNNLCRTLKAVQNWLNLSLICLFQNNKFIKATPHINLFFDQTLKRKSTIHENHVSIIFIETFCI